MIKTEAKFLGLDHLRALAITLVFIFHYLMFPHPRWLDSFFRFGWVGVDLFFVLSGFLISNQLFAEWRTTDRISLKNFYLKRAFRILPPFLFILLIYIFIPAFHEREKLPPLWKMFTFTQNFGQNIDVYGTFSHAWSLCVEEQFYLLLPMLLILIFSSRLKRYSGWLLPFVFIGMMVMRLIVWQFFLLPEANSDPFVIDWYKWIYYPTFTRLDGLTIGVAIASVYQFRKTWIDPLNKYANQIVIAGLILFVVSYFLCQDQHSFHATIIGFSLVAITFGFFVLSAILPGSVLFRSKSFITRNIAAFSYAIYLSHKGLIHLTQQFLHNRGIAENSGFSFLTCILVCITGAWLMRQLIEKPAMVMRNKLLKRQLSRITTARLGKAGMPGQGL